MNLWHHQIQQDEVRAPALGLAEALFSIRSCFNLKATIDEDGFGQKSDRMNILGYQDTSRCGQ